MKPIGTYYEQHLAAGSDLRGVTGEIAPKV
jgi:hypothetical protein